MISGAPEDKATGGTNGTRWPSVTRPAALEMVRSKRPLTKGRNSAGSNARLSCSAPRAEVLQMMELA